jgi:hypothetical protein
MIPTYLTTYLNTAVVSHKRDKPSQAATTNNISINISPFDALVLSHQTHTIHS